jgi:hypothetical protein
LLYSRTAKYTPALGYTADQYVVYSTPTDLISNLNQLGGITYCLVAPTGSGGTYGFFSQTNATTITGRTAGNDLLAALSYLAYGGKLVIAGTTAGLTKYENDNNTILDVLLGMTYDSGLLDFILGKPYLTAIMPSALSGTSFGIVDYKSINANATGSTFGSRIFNIYGTKNATQSTESIVSGTSINYTISAIPDVAGAFTRSKEKKEIFYTVAGIGRSSVLNGTITNSVAWDDSTTKNILRGNRVNFYVTSSPNFLGQDLIGGATGSTSVNITERIGPARLQQTVTYDVTQIGLKYLYQPNNATTRSKTTSEIKTYLEKYAIYLDTTKTQVICDSSNNVDNSSTLNITLVLRPIIATESFTLNFTLTT